jgi:SAM-dependent methyltransferase
MFIARLPFYKNLTRQRSRRIASKVNELLSTEQTLLDFGCGNLFTANELAYLKPGLRITGLDVIEDINLSSVSKNVSFRKYDGLSIPFADNMFEAALAASSMHHTHSPEFFLHELVRVVQPGGSIILVEEMYLNLFDRIIISGQDWILNKLKKDVPVPLNFRSLRHYLSLFKREGLSIVSQSYIRPGFPFMHHYVFKLKVNK